MARFRETVRTLLRERLLDAAFERVAEHGFDKLRMAHLAGDVGVSRQTLYSEFPSKEAVGEALFRRELERCLVGIQQGLDAHPDDLRAAVEAAVGFTLTLARRNPLIRAMLTSTGEGGLLPYLTTRSAAAFELATTMAGTYVAETWPSIDPVARDLAVDTAVRLTASHVVQATASPEESARRIADTAVRVALSTGAERLPAGTARA
ncbi:TetR/AcrR family transcriptional regulator [Streptomyces sp. R302]|uniref:TetR family transcriptional regulator n=1 Tax=unclassified Streptomyces TaxID=2593676 RepID=UPI00145D69CA|nr:MULTISPECIES: TetR family transcriptional regulator [unclassified Streptomyces]NML53716.1 TetR/AcrR family transcriptional regulator [Streptomyces sp. R301]NML82975.1 TetR/AcrR family transcriptional regulator [Streptomyces sp. R302]